MSLLFKLAILALAALLALPFALGVFGALLAGRPGWTVADEWDERRVA